MSVPCLWLSPATVLVLCRDALHLCVHVLLSAKVHYKLVCAFVLSLFWTRTCTLSCVLLSLRGSVSVCIRVGVCALECELSFVAVCFTLILLSLSVLVFSPFFQYHLANSGLGTTFCLEIGEIKQIKYKNK